MMLSKIIEISLALLTPTVAIIGTYIAIKQWKTNEANRRYELFNERYKNIYLEALDFYLEIKNMVYHGAEFDDTIELYEKYQAKLYKYRFFIKESDFCILENILSSFTSELEFYLQIRNKKEISKEETKRKKDFELNYYKIEKQIYLVMEKYLRIEKEHNFFFKNKKYKNEF